MSRNEIHYGLLCQHKEIQHRADHNEEYQREHKILLDTSCLDYTQFATSGISDIRCTITEEAVDDWQVKIVADCSTNPLCNRTEAMQEAINDGLIQELVNDVLAKPNDWLDD